MSRNLNCWWIKSCEKKGGEQTDNDSYKGKTQSPSPAKVVLVGTPVSDAGGGAKAGGGDGGDGGGDGAAIPYE